MARTNRFLLPVLILTAAFGVNSVSAQTVSFKNFNSFLGIVPGIDFFALNRQTIAPYEETAANAAAKLKYLIGNDIPKGAIFICSNLAQKDSLYEPSVLKQGYSWVLVLNTPEMRMEEQMERIKSQIGDNIPEEIRQRMSNMARNMPRDMMMPNIPNTLARDIAFAVLQTMAHDEYFQYRSSRVDDVSKSPLQDWLDIGISVYVSGDKSPVAYLRENLDLSFPIEDVLFMSRPFVGLGGTDMRNGGRNGMGGGGFPGGGFPAGGFPGGGFPGGDFPGGGFPGGGFPGGGFPAGGFPTPSAADMAEMMRMMANNFPGGFPGAGQQEQAKSKPEGGEQEQAKSKPGNVEGGQQEQAKSKPEGGQQQEQAKSKSNGGQQRQARSKPNGGQPRSMPKDEQDRMLFDGQSIAFFDYFLEKFGVEKMRELIKYVSQNNESVDYISRPDVLGPDFGKTESDWTEWLKKQPVPESKPKFKVQ